MTGVQRTPSRETGRPQVPPWVRSLLGIPLEIKLLGANLIILGLAVLVRESAGPLEDEARAEHAVVAIRVLP